MRDIQKESDCLYHDGGRNTLEAARPVQIRTRAYLKGMGHQPEYRAERKDKSGEEDSGSIPEYGKPDDGTAKCVRTYEEPA